MTAPRAATRPPGGAAQPPLGILARLRLLGLIWLLAARVAIALRRERLPDLVDRLAIPGGASPRPPRLLSRAVSRGLRIGPWVPRCLIRSLVLYRLLRAQGDEPELVIGLEEVRPGRDAHAWVELGGFDVGPEPGRSGHEPLARYPTDRPR
jgi:hypothetical protein